jgi:hypothetical protein
MTNLHNEGFSGEFELILAFLDKIFKLESLELHDVTNAQSLQILSLVEVTQDIFHVKWLITALRLETLCLFVEINKDIVIGIVRVGADAFFVRDHSLFDLLKDREQLLGCAFHISHGLLQLVHRAKAGEGVKRLLRTSSQVIGILPNGLLAAILGRTPHII